MSLFFCQITSEAWGRSCGKTAFLITPEHKASQRNLDIRNLCNEDAPGRIMHTSAIKQGRFQLKRANKQLPLFAILL